MALDAHACATARTAFGAPIRWAILAYVVVEPTGISRNDCQTRRWKAVPLTSSGRNTKLTLSCSRRMMLREYLDGWRIFP